MILLVAFYVDPDARRQSELLECLRRNTANSLISGVHVFLEDTRGDALVAQYPELGHDRISLVPHGRRARYDDLFAYASRHLAGQRVIVANADIYFDTSLARLDDYDLSGRFLCLSRWDVQDDGSTRFFECASSQDAWIFQTPLPEISAHFHLGVLGCDNRLAWEAQHAGLTVSNPSRTVRANHLHLSNVRRYARHWLAGPTLEVPADVLRAPQPSNPLDAMRIAAVAFRESMGYTIRRLASGASSHTNLERPFAALPAALEGLSYTQVVAYSLSPVEVEFLSLGRLYVLVGDDWDGSTAATEWLRAHGRKEDLPPLRTVPGPGFDVWSLVGAVGDRFVLPTQVMLVADQLVRAGEPRPPTRSGADPIYALTSLSPSSQAIAATRAAIQSWRAAGLDVRAFNHPTEIDRLGRVYDVEFVPVDETASAVFARHVVPVNAMLDWAAQHDAEVLLINSDIDLRMTPWELRRLRWLANRGLCYFVRFNHEGNLASARREPYGIDAFLLHGRDAHLFSRSFLSMGEPFWDYWLPHVFAAHNRPIASVEFPAAFHRRHAQRWSWDNWHRCALEFARTMRESVGDGSFEACLTMSLRVRQDFEARRTLVSRAPVDIRSWVQRTFDYRGPKTFLELGAHLGTDTQWLASVPDVTVYAFEPDPRNHSPAWPNVLMRRAAVADHDGRGALILSQSGWGQAWTHSSSIKSPKNHLLRFPVTFGESVEVDLVALDTFRAEHGLDLIDFIWADIQGAEGDMIRGGPETLARTRYLYTEYSDDEMYEHQPTLQQILALLPDFRVLEVWPDDVLLENQRFK